MPDRFTRHKVQGDQVSPTDLHAVQENVARSFDQLERKPQVADSLFLEREVAGTIEGIALTAGIENIIPHGLGRKFRGWQLADLNVLATIRRVSETTQDPAKFLVLETSVDCRIKLIVW